MMNTAIDSDVAAKLWSEYRGTSYTVAIDGRTLHIHVDRTTPDLDAELTRRDVTTWAFVTACNPRSKRLSPAENEEQQVRLKKELRQRGFTSAAGEGKGPDATWSPEESLLVFGISELDALAIGAQYRQLAIVVGQQNRPARLVACAKEIWCGE
jgi:Protein of unknown function (DUF3293)